MGAFEVAASWGRIWFCGVAASLAGYFNAGFGASKGTRNYPFELRKSLDEPSGRSAAAT